MATPLPGTTIAERYVVLALLGEGGMGQVVRARDTRLDREVAVKVLAARSVGDDRARERLLRESRAAAKLAHAGIVHVYDVGETADGGAFLVMELVRGETLRARLDRGELDAGKALQVAIECARALAFAHREGSVHRDVKPDNVMIRDDGRAALLDFGIAKSLGSNAPTLTDEGMVVGTPAYLAPEQARGDEVDGRADQFALAVTLYESLTGKVPWSGTSAATVVAAILRDEPAPPSTLVEGLPPEVDAVLERALRKSREDRYPHLDAFADALEEIAAKLGDAPRATPASLARTEALPTPGSRPTAAAAPVRPRWPWFVGGAFVVAVAAVFLAPRFLSSRDAARSAVVASASAAPSAGPTAITDVPLPPSTNPDALAAYRAGLQATRDGNATAMVSNFRRASELDPSMAAALFRYADVEFSVGNMEIAREAFNRTLLQRALLTPRDLAMAEAEALIISRSTPDFVGYRSRMRAVAAQYPLDAEVQNGVAWASYLMGDYDSAIAEGRRAVELDPHFGSAWVSIAFSLDRLERSDEAREAYESCLHAAPNATVCLANMMVLESARGDCGAYDARRAELLALDPRCRTRTGPRRPGSPGRAGRPRRCARRSRSGGRRCTGQAARSRRRTSTMCGSATSPRSSATGASGTPRSVD